MIPGNRPEDALEEKFWELLIDEANEAGLLSGPNALPASWVDSDGPIAKVINLARDLEYHRGFGEGKAEGIMSLAPAPEDESSRPAEDEDDSMPYGPIYA